MSTLIMKFGGTSVGSAEAIRSTAEIARGAARLAARGRGSFAMSGVTTPC
jgi:aspartokinase